MPFTLRPEQPCKDSQGASFLFYLFIYLSFLYYHVPVRNSQGHPLLLAPACPLSFLPHTFFSPLPSSLIPTPCHPFAWGHNTVSACDSTSSLDLSSFSCSIFFSTWQKLYLYCVHRGSLTDGRYLKKNSSSLFYLCGFAEVITNLLIISSLFSESYYESTWLRSWPKMSIKVYSQNVFEQIIQFWAMLRYWLIINSFSILNISLIFKQVHF